MMTYNENKAFIEDLHEVIKKHGLTIMYSNDSGKLIEETKSLEGYHMFFTKGHKKLSLRGGESVVPASSITIKFSKSNSEDDGC